MDSRECLGTNLSSAYMLYHIRRLISPSTTGHAPVPICNPAHCAVLAAAASQTQAADLRLISSRKTLVRKAILAWSTENSSCQKSIIAVPFVKYSLPSRNRQWRSKAGGTDRPPAHASVHHRRLWAHRSIGMNDSPRERAACQGLPRPGSRSRTAPLVVGNGRRGWSSAMVATRWVAGRGALRG